MFSCTSFSFKQQISVWSPILIYLIVSRFKSAINIWIESISFWFSVVVCRLASFMREFIPEAEDNHLFTLEFLVRTRIKESKLCMQSLMGESVPPQGPERHPQDDEPAAAAGPRVDSFEFTSRVPPKKLRCLNIWRSRKVNFWIILDKPKSYFDTLHIISSLTLVDRMHAGSSARKGYQDSSCVIKSWTIFCFSFIRSLSSPQPCWIDDLP